MNPIEYRGYRITTELETAGKHHNWYRARVNGEIVNTFRATSEYDAIAMAELYIDKLVEEAQP